MDASHRWESNWAGARIKVLGISGGGEKNSIYCWNPQKNRPGSSSSLCLTKMVPLEKGLHRHQNQNLPLPYTDLPVLLYGSETLLKSNMAKLEVFQLHCLRPILSVSLRHCLWKETIQKQCDHHPSIEQLIVCQMNNTHLPYKQLWRERPAHWKLQPAAPKKTWIKHIEEDLRSPKHCH